MKKIIPILVFFAIWFQLPAQSKVSVWDIAEVRVVNNDTLYLMELPVFEVVAKAPYALRKRIRRYNKLVRDVKKTYPYAKIAAQKMAEYEKIILSAKTKKEQRRRMEAAEIKLTKEFKKDIKNLTFKQGVILMKLIDRETGESSYEIIQELRGNVRAFFWQTLARLFGYNLKVEYDPEGEDKEIEKIVLQIERGEI